MRLRERVSPAKSDIRLVLDASWKPGRWCTFCFCCAAMAVLMSRFSSCTEMLSKRRSKACTSAMAAAVNEWLERQRVLYRNHCGSEIGSWLSLVKRQSLRDVDPRCYGSNLAELIDKHRQDHELQMCETCELDILNNAASGSSATQNARCPLPTEHTPSPLQMASGKSQPASFPSSKPAPSTPSPLT